MIRHLNVLFFLALPLFVFAGPSSTVPAWPELENRIYQEPLIVLEELKLMDYEVWTDKQKVQYFDALSNAYFVMSDYESAERTLNSGWLLRDRAEPYTLINMMTSRAYFKELSGDLAGAEAEYHSAMRVADQSGSSDAVLLALNSMISFYSFTKEEYELALGYVERATTISGSESREFLVADLHNYFGSILSYLGDTEQSFEQYQVAEAIYRKHENNVSLSAMLYNQAMLHDESENYIAALRAYEVFMTSAESWGDPTAEFFGNMGIANSYSYLERYFQAYESLKLAQNAISYIVDPVYLFDFWSSVVYIAADVDDFDWANEAIIKVESLVDQVTDEDVSWYHYEMLNGKTYVATLQEDYQAAFDFSEELRWIQFDLMEGEQQAALQEILISSENAMYQSETDRLSSENRKQQSVISDQNQIQQLLVVSLIVVTSCLIALGVAFRNKLRQMRVLQQYSAISESVKTSGLRVMENVAGMMFDQSEQRDSPLSVVVFEFSNLPEIREGYGQQAVDSANSWVSETLEAELRNEDKFGQIDFGRFMMLLPGAKASVARKQADRLLQLFRDNPIPNWADVKLEASAGISERSRHDQNPYVLTHRATTAVDIAKDLGGYATKILAV